MKKYLLGLTAVVLAISLSAFTKAKFVNDVLKLTVSPTSTSIISDETKWRDDGSQYGTCTNTTVEDLGCRILADPKYTHVNGSGKLVLNTPGDTPMGEFQLTITETTGLFIEGGEDPDIQFYKVLNVTSNDNTDSRGNGFDFVNAKIN